jgi:hypothetical protein
MTKEQFTVKVAARLESKISSEKSQTDKQINSQRERMGKPAFLEWVKNEGAAAASVPALKMYASIFTSWATAPAEVAQKLADFIEHDIRYQLDTTGKVKATGKVNWLEQWEQASPVISAGNLFESEWKYRALFIDYMDALIADMRTRTFKGVSYKKPKEEHTSNRTIAYYEYYRDEFIGMGKKRFIAAVEVAHKNAIGGSVYNEWCLIVGEPGHRTQPAHITDLENAILLMVNNGVDETLIDKARAELSTALKKEKRKS